jgi:hypothetical protein
VLNPHLQSGVVEHICNLRTRETEEGGLQVPGQLELKGEALCKKENESETEREREREREEGRKEERK